MFCAKTTIHFQFIHVDKHVLQRRKLGTDIIFHSTFIVKVVEPESEFARHSGKDFYLSQNSYRLVNIFSTVHPISKLGL